MNEAWLGAVAQNGEKLISLVETHGVVFSTITFAVLWLRSESLRLKSDASLIESYKARVDDAITSERKAGEIIAANTEAQRSLASGMTAMSTSLARHTTAIDEIAARYSIRYLHRGH